MGYTFKGVFVAEPALSVESMAELFSGYAREISDPFRGIGVSFKEKEWDFGRDELRQKILTLSQSLPGKNVLYLDYTTWAGPIDYVHGIVVRDGELLREDEAEEMEQCDRLFLEMLTFLGLESPSGFFAPFERGFFPNT